MGSEPYVFVAWLAWLVVRLLGLTVLPHTGARDGLVSVRTHVRNVGV
jgi:hypothetical protein